MAVWDYVYVYFNSKQKLFHSEKNQHTEAKQQVVNNNTELVPRLCLKVKIM